MSASRHFSVRCSWQVYGMNVFFVQFYIIILQQRLTASANLLLLFSEEAKAMAKVSSRVTR